MTLVITNERVDALDLNRMNPCVKLHSSLLLPLPASLFPLQVVRLIATGIASLAPEGKLESREGRPRIVVQTDQLQQVGFLDIVVDCIGQLSLMT